MNSVIEMENVASIRKGFNFQFIVDEHTIDVWGSGWNGRETVKVDGLVVSDKRSFGRKADHQFKLEGKLFEIEFNMVSILKGTLHCSLIEDGVHLKTKKQALKPSLQLNRKTFFVHLLIGLLIGCGFWSLVFHFSN